MMAGMDKDPGLPPTEWLWEQSDKDRNARLLVAVRAHVADCCGCCGKEAKARIEAILIDIDGYDGDPGEYDPRTGKAYSPYNPPI